MPEWMMAVWMSGNILIWGVVICLGIPAEVNLWRGASSPEKKREQARNALGAMALVPAAPLWPLAVVGAICYGAWCLLQGLRALVRDALPDKPEPVEIGVGSYGKGKGGHRPTSPYLGVPNPPKGPGGGSRGPRHFSVRNTFPDIEAESCDCPIGADHHRNDPSPPEPPKGPGGGSPKGVGCECPECRRAGQLRSREKYKVTPVAIGQEKPIEDWPQWDEYCDHEWQEIRTVDGSLLDDYCVKCGTNSRTMKEER